MKPLFSFVYLLFLYLPARPQTAATHWNLEKGMALQGYDAVAYHSQQKAVKGTARFAVTHLGAVWLFASAENKEIFRKNPEKFEPAYGGWCAFAMGDSGKKVEVDPDTFKLIDGKLYLFYNKYFTNTLLSWNKKESVLKAKGDANWEKIIR
ncbi:YHS domain-containing (seleno)protein [Flavihumibacter sp. CACIAM 22H1]|uniref:YHS domain-containing (seleno)protein n=1 Tax=Flavihumibacter sp. CACIAM 22H1 TaxID=1812911 RepID=UPI0007A85C0E|nr:YHS domain-containing (seleno)protein [Flavihumibacter sp. CACIAM 22H1]KYP13696.1 MAG: YHS domain protein [Flavihumibacter sp. CACIAM 22H1]